MTKLEQRILAFAVARRPLFAARTEFGWSPTAYVQKLYALLEDSRVEQESPLEVHALQRLRDERSSARASRTFRRAS